MATKEYGVTDRSKGILTVTSSENSTSKTINAYATFYYQKYYQSSYKISVSISGGSSSTKDPINITSLSSTWDDYGQTSTISRKVNKTHSTQTITVSSSYSGSSKGTYNAGSKSGSTTYSVTVDPLDSYTVSYNANGGSGAPSSQTKWYGESLTLSSTKPTRTGYTFNGWNTSSSGSGTNYSSGGSYTANAAVTLYAKWKINTYSVTYNANGGSGAPSSQTKTYGIALTLSSAKPTRTGYTFDGWYANSSGTGTKYSKDIPYTANADITLYAKWKINTYSVKYNANGGSGAPPNQTKTYGTVLTLSSTRPTKENYNFVGWNTASNGNGTNYSPGGSYKANAAVTLYAKWEEASSSPVISNIQVKRVLYNSESDEYKDDPIFGDMANISFDWSCDQSAGTNTCTDIILQYNNSTIHISDSEQIGSISGSISNYLLSDITNTYDTIVTITVSDSNEKSTSKEAIINAGRYYINFLSEQLGVAIGKPANEQNIFDVNLESIFRKKTNSYNNDVAYIHTHATSGKTISFGVGVGGTNRGLFDTTNNKWMININNNDLYLGPPRTSVTYIPYYKTGDVIQITSLHTAGYVSNSSKSVYFIVPLSKPIIGSPVATASSTIGFYLRQNNNYTHGSSASNAVNPSSYSAEIFSYGIRITAVFNTITNAINNSPIGISWTGTITFS